MNADRVDVLLIRKSMPRIGRQSEFVKINIANGIDRILDQEVAGAVVLHFEFSRFVASCKVDLGNT